jgi:hypothetical protein
MKCPFCTTMMEEVYFEGVDEHLLVVKMGDHIHVHGPISNKDLIIEFLTTIAKEAGLELENS